MAQDRCKVNVGAHAGVWWIAEEHIHTPSIHVCRRRATSTMLSKALQFRLTRGEYHCRVLLYAIEGFGA